MRCAPLCTCAFIFICTFGVCAPPAAGNTLTITSVPPGATVEMDGLVVGKTPFSTKMPGGYFHKTHTLWGERLEHPIVVRISLDGYASQDLTITEGPLVWRSLKGNPEAVYWLVKTDHFDVTLEPLSNIFTGEPKITGATSESSSAAALLSDEQLVKKAIPAIVRIENPHGWGTGFFITSTGLIATNKHVVEDQSILTARTADERRLAVRVVYLDHDKDLALVKVEGSGFPHLVLAGIDSIARGESVLAIGNPAEGLKDTVTRGVVSAIGPDRANGNGTWIQTDAAINAGNSGGPLLDSRGEVIGINAIQYLRNRADEPVRGINFALSAEDLIDVLRRFYPASENPEHKAGSAGSATVTVSSEPAGAEIYLDGKFVGDTPSVLQVSAGAHKIRVEAAGRKAFERELDVLRGSQISLTANLESIP